MFRRAVPLCFPLILGLLVSFPARADEGDDDDDDEEAEKKEEAEDEYKPIPTGLSAYKSGGPFGIGFVVGTINGLSLKIWPAPAFGLVVEFGVPHVLNSMAVGLSGRFHFEPIRVPDSPVTIHVNLGPRFRTRMVFGSTVYAELGGGVAAGASIVVRAVPVELYFDVAPNFAAGIGGVGVGFDVDGLVGVRFFL